MKTKLIAILAVYCSLAFTAPRRAQAQSSQRVQGSEHQPRVLAPSRCTLFADSVPVWLWVYEELERNGDGAYMLHDGKLERGGKRIITSGTERIRYAYKTAENDEMHDNIGAGCYKGNTVRVP
jgi:hypothetical protein